MTLTGIQWCPFTFTFTTTFLYFIPYRWGYFGHILSDTTFYTRWSCWVFCCAIPRFTLHLPAMMVRLHFISRRWGCSFCWWWFDVCCWWLHREPLLSGGKWSVIGIRWPTVPDLRATNLPGICFLSICRDYRIHLFCVVSTVHCICRHAMMAATILPTTLHSTVWRVLHLMSVIRYSIVVFGGHDTMIDVLMMRYSFHYSMMTCCCYWPCTVLLLYLFWCRCYCTILDTHIPLFVPTITLFPVRYSTWYYAYLFDYRILFWYCRWLFPDIFLIPIPLLFTLPLQFLIIIDHNGPDIIHLFIVLPNVTTSDIHTVFTCCRCDLLRHLLIVWPANLIDPFRWLFDTYLLFNPDILLRYIWWRVLLFHIYDTVFDVLMMMMTLLLFIVEVDRGVMMMMLLCVAGTGIVCDVRIQYW